MQIDNMPMKNMQMNNNQMDNMPLNNIRMNNNLINNNQKNNQPNLIEFYQNQINQLEEIIRQKNIEIEYIKDILNKQEWFKLSKSKFYEFESNGGN